VGVAVVGGPALAGDHLACLAGGILDRRGDVVREEAGLLARERRRRRRRTLRLLALERDLGSGVDGRDGVRARVSVREGGRGVVGGLDRRAVTAGQIRVSTSATGGKAWVR
jgi:hypothetical protein